MATKSASPTSPKTTVSKASSTRAVPAVSSTRNASFTAPGMSTEDGATVVDILQERLSALIDLSLTLKHIHWNVVGPSFIGVHLMLDPQYAGVQVMIDTTAESRPVPGMTTTSAAQMCKPTSLRWTSSTETSSRAIARPSRPPTSRIP
jgi:DNA-binding ferritin-like protein